MQPDRPRALGGTHALDRQLGRFLDAPGLVDLIADVHVGASELVGEPELLRDRQRHAQDRDPTLAIAELCDIDPDRVQRVAFRLARADRARDRKRLLRDRQRSREPVADHQHPGHQGEHLGTFRGRLRRRQLDRAGVRGDRVVAPPGGPEAAAQPDLHERRRGVILLVLERLSRLGQNTRHPPRSRRRGVRPHRRRRGSPCAIRRRAAARRAPGPTARARRRSGVRPRRTRRRHAPRRPRRPRRPAPPVGRARPASGGPAQRRRCSPIGPRDPAAGECLRERAMHSDRSPGSRSS